MNFDGAFSSVPSRQGEPPNTMEVSIRMTKRVILAAMLVVVLTAGRSFAQDGVECMVCQMVLSMVESSLGDGKNIGMDAGRQCALLPEADRAECMRFYAAMGPKFIKAIKNRTARGESLEDLCRSMGYCAR